MGLQEAVQRTGELQRGVSTERRNGIEAKAYSEPAARPGGEARRILLALTQLGGMQIVVAFSTLARNKALAVYLKPQGFGEFSQMMAIAAPLWLVVQCGMAVGLSRNTAAVESHEDRQRQLGTANLLTAMLALISLGIVIPLLLSPAGDEVLRRLGIVPGISQKILLVLLLGLAPLEALRNNFLSFLQGLLDIKGISARRSIAVIASTVAAIPLIAILGMSGACIQAAVGTLVLAVLLGIRCLQNGFNPLAFTWDSGTAKLLASFGAAALLIGFSQNSVDAMSRAFLIESAGVGANGLFQASFALSTQVTTVVLGSVGAYSLAVLSQSVDSEVLKSRVEDLLRVVLPVSTLGLGAVGLVSRPMLSILYSPQFDNAANFMPILLIANYVQVGTWALGAPLLGRALIRYWIGVQLVSASIRFGVAFLLVERLGGYAIAAGFLCGLVFDLLAYATICRRRIGIGIEPQTASRFVVGAASVLLAALAGSFAANPASYVALTAAACLLCGMAFRLQGELAARVAVQYYRRVTSRW